MRFTYPNHNDSRKVIKFAFLPTVIYDEIVWLEKYTDHQHYENKKRIPGQGKRQSVYKRVIDKVQT